MKVNNILCEYLDNPIGLGIASPRITWTDSEITKQKAFEIKYKVNGVLKNGGNISGSGNYVEFATPSPSGMLEISIMFSKYGNSQYRTIIKVDSSEV